MKIDRCGTKDRPLRGRFFGALHGLQRKPREDEEKKIRGPGSRSKDQEVGGSPAYRKGSNKCPEKIRRDLAGGTSELDGWKVAWQALPKIDVKLKKASIHEMTVEINKQGGRGE